MLYYIRSDGVILPSVTYHTNSGNSSVQAPFAYILRQELVFSMPLCFAPAPPAESGLQSQKSYEK